jgi:hypothetical protein
VRTFLRPLTGLARADATLRAVARVAALVLACVTCDATTALRPPEARDVTLDWSGDTVVVVGGSLVPTLSAEIDGEPYAIARIALVSSDTSVVAIAPDGRTLLGRRLGHATLTARLLSTTLETIPTLAREVVVSPAAVRIGGGVDTLFSLGDTVRLSASAVDASDAAIPTSGVRWTSTDTSVLVVDALGLVTARRNGAATVRAQLGTQVAEAPIEVWQRAARLRFDVPQLVLDAISAESTVVAIPLDARGGAILRTPTPQVTWSYSASTVATVTAGRVVAMSNGTGWVQASTDGARDSLRVDVAQRATRVVIETAGPLQLHAIGETAIARARSYDRKDNEVTSSLPAWRTLNPQVAYVESRTGIVTALSAGAGQLVAEQDGVSASLAVAVTNAAAQLTLEPAAATITSVGDTLAMRWTVRNARGVEIADAPVTLTSSDTTILRPVGAGRVEARALGTVRVIATTDAGPADTSLVTVTNAVENVAFAVHVATMGSVGDSLVPAIDIRNARGASVPRTSAGWSSDDPGTARVTAGGIVIAMGAGETVIRAWSPTYPDRRDSLVLTVTNAPASVTIERNADTLVAIGATRTYSAEVRNGRDALLAITPSWRSLDQGVARVSGTGLVSSVAIGTARIVATAGTVSDTLIVTVRDDVAALDVTPSTFTMTSVGDVARPAVLARNAMGTIITDPRVTWMSMDTTIVKLLADSSLLAASTGTTRVIATGGRVADTLTITVTNLPAFLDIHETLDSLFALGDSIRLAVTIRNARGDALPASSVTWSVDDPAVVRVSAIGQVTSLAVGTTWVRATGGSVRDSMRIVSTNDVTSISIVLATSGIAATTDTMTASGQFLPYAARVANALGNPVPGASVSWSSTSPGVASVATNGVVTAIGTGTALVVAQAGTVRDTVRIVVIDPTRIYVDNLVVMPYRFGTAARPYATIQDGVNAATVDDTVIVRRGSVYSESVTLSRRITVLGDSTDFVAGGRDALLLPRLAHDVGAAGITASTSGSSFTIRYLAVQHSVDGDAVAIRDADNVLLDNVFVNPVPGFRAGRGLLVERATGSVLITRGRVDSVYAYGVRVADAANVRVDAVTVRGIGARAGETGAGIEVARSQNVVVTGVTARRTAGPQVLLDRTTNASLLASTFTGEWQLARLSGVLGTTTVRGNTFDMRRQAGESAPSRTAVAPDPSGLEVVGSAGLVIDANTFVDIGGQTSLMDGVRLGDVRVGTSGAAFGAQLTGNRFGGGRTALRADRATFSMSGARIDSAAVGVLLADADTATLSLDTLVNVRVAAVQTTGTAANLAISSSVITGPQRAVVTTGAANVVLRRNTITGGVTTGATPQPSLGAVDIDASTVEIVDNTVTNVRGWAALHVRRGIARVDSNFVSRNLVGLRIGAVAAPTISTRGNSLFDNDTLPNSARRSTHGVINDGAAVTLGSNWWGDPRGPMLNGPSAPSTSGDSAIGPGTYQFANAPIGAHVGLAPATVMRKIFGDGQTSAAGAYAPDIMLVRVVDGQNRPVSGVAVTWKVSRIEGNFYNGVRSGADNIVTTTTDANGLSWAWFTGSTSGVTSTITAFTGSLSVTFTAITQ